MKVKKKLQKPGTTSTSPTHPELDMETTNSTHTTDTTLVNMTVLNLTDHTTSNTDGDTSSMEISLPIPGGGLLPDTSGPTTQKEQVSFTNTTWAQVLSSMNGILVTPPGSMEIYMQWLDTHTNGMEITLGSTYTKANTMVEFTMKVPSFKALREEHSLSTEETIWMLMIGLSIQPTHGYTDLCLRNDI